MDLGAVIGYIRGLRGDADRENGWQLAGAAGDPTPDGVHHLLARADGDAGAVRDDPRGTSTSPSVTRPRCSWWARPGS